jgi:hypothetical protein
MAFRHHCPPPMPSLARPSLPPLANAAVAVATTLRAAAPVATKDTRSIPMQRGNAQEHG